MMDFYTKQGKKKMWDIIQLCLALNHGTEWVKDNAAGWRMEEKRAHVECRLFSIRDDAVLVKVHFFLPLIH